MLEPLLLIIVMQKLWYIIVAWIKGEAKDSFNIYYSAYLYLI